MFLTLEFLSKVFKGTATQIQMLSIILRKKKGIKLANIGFGYFFVSSKYEMRKIIKTHTSLEKFISTLETTGLAINITNPKIKNEIYLALNIYPKKSEPVVLYITPLTYILGLFNFLDTYIKKENNGDYKTVISAIFNFYKNLKTVPVLEAMISSLTKYHLTKLTPSIMNKLYGHLKIYKALKTKNK